MVKKIFSVLMALIVFTSAVAPAAFADDVLEVCPKCGERTYTTRQDFSMSTADYSMPISIKKRYCTSCNYTYYDWNCLGITGYKDFDNGGYNFIVDYLNDWKDKTFGKNATASEWQAGGGSASPGGVGRNPAGYAGEGVPNYNNNGTLQVALYPDVSIYSSTPYYSFPYSFNYTDSSSRFYVSGNNNTILYNWIASSNGKRLTTQLRYYLDCKVTGLYYNDVKLLAMSNIYNYDSKAFVSSYIPENTISKKVSSGSREALYTYTVGTTIKADASGYNKYTALVHPIILSCIPDTNTVTNQTNITINNNTWNGNIYTDNSTNLTYIYPQYTTINENNETVTNISNNPIIYNNETKQYYTYDSVTNNYYYITYNAPTPTPTPTPDPTPSTSPVPTWQPGGGATHGGGVGRHPYDADKSDWTLHYYILNNRRYDAYYALKKTEVDAQTKLPWVDNKKYISTTQIPIANGQYTVTVPEGVYWRVWQWDETSQTLTGLNSSNWHSSMNYFLFNATGEYIFEFCKADGLDFNSAKDVILKLKNDRITDYEDGGTEIENKPIVPDTQNLIIPKMNANSFTDEHGTWVASGSSKYSDVFDFFYAFDRSTANFWETNVSPSYLQIEIPDPESYYIDGYIMRISKFNNRYSKDWTLQGSDDGETWDDLDKQTGQNLSDMEEHKYTLTLRKAYKYCRLNMSNYASSMCSLSHFNLLGYAAKDVTFPTPDPGGSTPDPDKPTPTPTPGGSDSSGDGSDSNPFKWFGELFKDILDGIIKGLWKIITSIFGFILWLLSLLFKLFPWMPNSALVALCGGVVVVTIIRIIKFITGR
ncbi:hypothetical protein [uncultured Gemmiger sp.]|uniref:hypothetical protein n=1 Tax=uncultured Gemmiger sp. TaxID=1623490 RepID=UPI0025F4271A|nr:hypothetical protein [uncultured Gemmiger sp.]